MTVVVTLVVVYCVNLSPVSVWFSNEVVDLHSLRLSALESP